MSAAYKIFPGIVLLIFSQVVFAQQLRLGKNPYTVEKSAVLELYSDNQGLLLPRIADTSLINILNPPDGMIIYFTPAQKLLVRSNGYWQTPAMNNSVVTSLNGNTGVLTMDTSYIGNFYLKVRSLHSVTAPLVYNSSTGVIGITQASSSANGYLSSTDWNIFNNKANSFSSGNLTETGSSVLTVTGGTGSVIGSGTTIQVKQASGTQNGFLSSTDWSTFNNKVSTTRTINTTAPLQGGGDLSANRTLSIAQANTSTNGYLSSTDWNTFNNKANSFSTGNLTETGSGVLTITGGTGSVIGSGTTIQVKQANTTQSGFLSNTDWNTFNSKLSSVDTTNISNFSVKVRSLFSGTAPITYANGVIGITQATTSTNGYLSSTDWNTFNNKAGSSNVWLLSGNAGTNPSTNFIGTTDNQDLVFKTNNTETLRIVSSTGDVKIGNATSGTLRSTQELVLRQDGDTYGSSILRLRNRNTENGAIFETTDPSTTLVDFIFKTATSQRNIRYEARSTYARAGTPSFHIGGSSPDNPTLAVGDSYAAFNTNLKIGNYNTPTEALDVTGNIRFSGALMPNNSAGTSGYILSSNGSGAAPTWINFKINNLNDVAITSPSNGQLLQLNGTNWVNVTLNHLADPGGNGIIARTSLNTTTNRTITGTTNKITVTNGEYG